jgi:hypothetical protein
MRQRGRKGDLKMLCGSAIGEQSRLEPPPYLNKAERSLFGEIVAACAPEHFTEADAPLLCAYVTAALLGRKLARDTSKVGQWEKVTRTMATLAVKLRICPHSRTDPKTITRNIPLQQPFPWQDWRADDEESTARRTS